jgi:hypothetical protein
MEYVYGIFINNIVKQIFGGRIRPGEKGAVPFPKKPGTHGLPLQMGFAQFRKKPMVTP